MKTVIYQYYDGETTSGNEAGRKAMSQYAKRIGSSLFGAWRCDTS